MIAVLQVLALLAPTLGILTGLFWMILADVQPPVASPPPTTGSHRKVVRPSYQPYVARHAL